MMNDYREIRLDFVPCTEVETDVMAAILADAGYETFVPDASGLTAYIPSAKFDADALETAVASFPLPAAVRIVSAETIEGRDWNAEWERNYFKPIVVGRRCAIHSSFHTDVPVCDYDIVIDPKMAFGTGHHATTSLILEQILEMDLLDKRVIDMGTGTGILAILAAMRGARPVTGIEIDPPAWENAVANAALNRVPQVEMLLGDASLLAGRSDVDLFMANINRNIITADLPAYAATLRPGATVLLSGFYIDDIPVVTAAAEACGLRAQGHTERDRWACLRLARP